MDLRQIISGNIPPGWISKLLKNTFFTIDLLFDYLSVGNWEQSKDITSTQQPCDSTTGLVIAKKHFRKLELLYIPLEGPTLKEVDIVD